MREVRISTLRNGAVVGIDFGFVRVIFSPQFYDWRPGMVAQLNSVLTLILSAACICIAQQAPLESSLTFRSETQEVLLSFNVLRGLYFAPDVKQEDVLLFEDGKPRDFSVFEGPGIGSR